VRTLDRQREPELAGCERAVEQERGARPQRVHALPERVGSERVSEREELPESAGRRVAGQRAGVGERRGFRGGDERSVAEHRVEERLLPEAVARQQDRTVPRIPERQREHAVQPRERIDAVAHEKPQHDLGVARGLEARAVALELAPQSGEAVDLAVEDQHRSRRGVDHRLVRRRARIDDREPAMREDSAGPRDEPLGIRSAMRESPRDPAHAVGPRAGIRPRRERDAAHQRGPRAGDASDAAAGRRPLAVQL